MVKQMVAYVSTLVLLLITDSYSFVQFEHTCSALKQCTSNTENYFDKWADPKDTSEINYYNEHHSIHQEVFYPINLPLLPILFARSEYLPNGQCKEDSRLFFNELRNETLWAMQMFDSSSKYPDGILYGNTRHLGNFDECYNLQVDVRENSGNDKITGRYCLIDLQYQRKNASVSRNIVRKPFISDFDPKGTFWDAIEERGNPYRIRRYFLQLALCVPSACSAEDVETVLKSSIETINKNNNIEIQITVDKNFCQAAVDAPNSVAGAIIYCILMLSLLIFIIVATWFDNELKSNESSISGFRKTILCFSAWRNWKNIFQPNYFHPGMDSTHLLRFILNVLVINVHFTIQYLFNPTNNFFDLEKFILKPIAIFYAKGFVMTDIFLGISAVLVTYQLLKNLDRQKRLNFFTNILSRYFRLTPSYMTVIFFHAWVLPLLGSGPFWKYEIEQESTRCATNWWTNLLYINNYVKSTEICMFQSWYLSVNFQFFILNQFIIYAFWRMSRKIGYFFLGTLTFASCLIPFIAAYFYGAVPVLMILQAHKLEDVPYYLQYYIKTHMRAPGNLIGVIAGAILYDHGRIKWRLSKFWSHILVVPLPLIVLGAFYLWSRKIFIPYGNWSIFENAFYAFWFRLIPALCICTMIVVLSTGSQLEFYQNIFTPRWVQPLAVLSYGSYLVTDTFNAYHSGQTRSAKSFSCFNVIWETMPILITSFAVSFFITICIEMPFRQLAKQF
ncbi:nose resistant to fluoxetine protein 6 [Ooceraea biroi]|uniref:nose resistant to fluoxetine protein 6 n=1 Tax=Ooceraea biroi TaxID=2015173 RepID=UPI000F0911DD|nr:nose resistant to fluoxetine protein 6 [Ooceraea biroi]